MRIDLVVFDVAGTTVKDDDAVNDIMRSAIASAGTLVDRAAVAAVMGLPKPESIRLLLSRARSRPPTLEEVDEVHTAFVEQMTNHYLESSRICEVPGAAATFRRLREAGVKVALDTGFSRLILDAVLGRLGWYGDGLIDVTVASDEVLHGRPYPDMIERAMALTGIQNPEYVAKVGDTAADMREGHAAFCGCVIGVLSGTGTFEELAQFDDTVVVADITKVPDVIGVASPRRTDAQPHPPV
ncbi:MAG: HAD hydrolase-like protein [Polyangiaceae bacterium]|nr:HAD hydrolase-like protein [Polyangiaceae bacterium]